MKKRIVVLLKNILNMPKRLVSHISLFCILQEANINRKAAICSNVKFYRSKIGKYSYIGNKSFVSDAEIGNFTSISTNCYIGGANHPINWVSTSPVFHEGRNIMRKNFSHHEFEPFKRTKIGNDVWIGNGVMIKAGLTIGDGAIIGMGSVVTKDVGPYEIWAGNPAKMIRKRFDIDKINKMLEIKWWNWEDEEIEKYAKTFNDIDEFERRN